MTQRFIRAETALNERCSHACLPPFNVRASLFLTFIATSKFIVSCCNFAFISVVLDVAVLLQLARADALNEKTHLARVSRRAVHAHTDSPGCLRNCLKKK